MVVIPKNGRDIEIAFGVAGFDLGHAIPERRGAIEVLLVGPEVADVGKPVAVGGPVARLIFGDGSRDLAVAGVVVGQRAMDAGGPPG